MPIDVTSQAVFKIILTNWQALPRGAAWCVWNGRWRLCRHLRHNAQKSLSL